MRDICAFFLEFISVPFPFAENAAAIVLFTAEHFRVRESNDAILQMENQRTYKNANL